MIDLRVLRVDPGEILIEAYDDEIYVGHLRAAPWHGTFYVRMVTVEPAHRRKRIAVRLLKRTASLVHSRFACEFGVLHESLTDDGRALWAHLAARGYAVSELTDGGRWRFM